MHAVDIREEVRRYLNSLGLHPSHTLREGEEGRGSSPINYVTDDALEHIKLRKRLVMRTFQTIFSYSTVFSDK